MTTNNNNVYDMLITTYDMLITTYDMSNVNNFSYNIYGCTGPLGHLINTY